MRKVDKLKIMNYKFESMKQRKSREQINDESPRA